MKTIKNAQLITLMLIALNVFGFNTKSNDLFVNFNQNGSEVTGDSTILVIKDEKGQTLYQEKVKSSDVLPSHFDWSELADGTYRLEYEKGMEIKVVPVSISNANVKFNPSYKTFVPVVNKKGKLVYVSKMAFENQSLDISIYDSFNELVYHEYLNDPRVMGRIFDFSESYENRFKVVVKSNGRTYTKKILM